MGALGTWDLADELSARPDARRTATIATVSRVDDDGSVWVRLPGADADTPVNGQTYVDAKPGQTVQATIEGGRCSITGNASSPAVGGGYVRQVIAPVEQKATNALDEAQRAHDAADAAEKDADRARVAAESAESSADTAATAAGNAVISAASAANSASQAASDATSANASARQALLGLSTVEDVVNVLEWLTAHSKATTDTTAVTGKAYYQRDATTGAMTRYEVPAGGNPASLGLYELDDAVADYIAAHLALTTYGLNIMLDSSSGYIHLGTVDGTYAKGMYFIDGGEVVALFGADGSRIGSASGRHVTVRSDGLTMSASAVQDMFNVGNVETPVTQSDFLASKSTIEREFEGDATGITSEAVSGTIQLGTVQVPDQVTYFSVDLVAGGGSYDDAGKTITNSDISPRTMYSSSRLVSKELAGSGADVFSAALSFRYYGDPSHTNPSTKHYPFTLRLSYDATTKTMGVSMTGFANSAVTSFNDVCWVGSVRVLIQQYVPSVTYYPAYMTFGSRDSGHDIGAFSAAFGEMNAAMGENSVAEGWMSHAIGDNSHAEGCKSTALGTNSHAEGYDTTATGDYVHAEGSGSKAVGDDSHAEGSDTVANGECSHAEGLMSTANGANAHAEGSETYANGRSSHAEGDGTNAGGEASHAQNVGTVAAYSNQTAIGKYNDNQPSHAFEVGNGTSDSSRSNAFAVDWDGIPYHNNPAGTFGSLFDLVYPVGAIYMSTASTSPATLFGGTWERITGKFLLAATDGGAAGGNSSASIAAGKTGGEASHALTPAETATKDHSHTMNHGHGFTQPTITVKRSQAAASGSATYVPSVSGSNSVTNVASASGGAVTNHTGSTGGQTAANGSAHNNMPPYLAVYVWKRTA